MAQQVFEQRMEWSDHDTAFPGIEEILDNGQAAVAELIRSIVARGLPPGATVEIEFAVRGRETVLA